MVTLMFLRDFLNQFLGNPLLTGNNKIYKDRNGNLNYITSESNKPEFNIPVTVNETERVFGIREQRDDEGKIIGISLITMDYYEKEMDKD